MNIRKAILIVLLAGLSGSLLAQANGWVYFGTGAQSTLKVKTAEVDLTVCGSNVPSYDLLVVMDRPPVSGYPGRVWNYKVSPDGAFLVARYRDSNSSTWVDIRSQVWSSRSGSCTILGNLDGNGDSFANTLYETAAALNAWPSERWPTPCYEATKGIGLCDAKSR